MKGVFLVSLTFLYIYVKNVVRKVRKLESASKSYPSMSYCLTFFLKTFG